MICMKVMDRLIPMMIRMKVALGVLLRPSPTNGLSNRDHRCQDMMGLLVPKDMVEASKAEGAAIALHEWSRHEVASSAVHGQLIHLTQAQSVWNGTR